MVLFVGGWSVGILALQRALSEGYILHTVAMSGLGYHLRRRALLRDRRTEEAR